MGSGLSSWGKESLIFLSQELSFWAFVHSPFFWVVKFKGRTVCNLQTRAIYPGFRVSLVYHRREYTVS